MSCTASTRLNGEVAIVDLAGKFTIGDATGVIRGIVNCLLDAGKKQILINLHHVSYMDSAAGIGELVGSYTSTVRRGAVLKLEHPGKNLDHVLRITGLHTVFEIYDDEEAALRSFEQKATTAGAAYR